MLSFFGHMELEYIYDKERLLIVPGTSEYFDIRNDN